MTAQQNRAGGTDLRSLLAKATPGEWHYTGHGWVQDASGKPVANFNFYAHIPGNAELIARCNPAVMEQVLQALESCKYRPDENWGSQHSFDEDAVAKALALLNGTTQP